MSNVLVYYCNSIKYSISSSDIKNRLVSNSSQVYYKYYVSHRYDVIELKLSIDRQHPQMFTVLPKNTYRLSAKLSLALKTITPLFSSNLLNPLASRSRKLRRPIKYCLYPQAMSQDINNCRKPFSSRPVLRRTLRICVCLENLCLIEKSLLKGCYSTKKMCILKVLAHVVVKPVFLITFFAVLTNLSTSPFTLGHRGVTFRCLKPRV